VGKWVQGVFLIRIVLSRSKVGLYGFLHTCRILFLPLFCRGVPASSICRSNDRFKGCGFSQRDFGSPYTAWRRRFLTLRGGRLSFFPSPLICGKGFLGGLHHFRIASPFSSWHELPLSPPSLMSIRQFPLRRRHSYPLPCMDLIDFPSLVTCIAVANSLLLPASKERTSSWATFFFFRSKAPLSFSVVEDVIPLMQEIMSVVFLPENTFPFPPFFENVQLVGPSFFR